jgi:hypothetical protein
MFFKIIKMGLAALLYPLISAWPVLHSEEPSVLSIEAVLKACQ